MATERQDEDIPPPAAAARRPALPRLGRAGVAAVAASAVAVLVGAVLFEDNLAKALIRPSVPYQTYTPPEAPNYADADAWAMRPHPGDDGAADVFFVHSTTYASSAHWNAPYNDPQAQATLREVAAPNEAGPFEALGRLSAPYYRQATLFAQFTHKYEGLAAYALAFSDVDRAFAAFLKEKDPARPLILVGYGQGGLHVAGLLRKYFGGDRNPLRNHLVAAYVVGFPIPVAYPAGFAPPLPVCEAATSVRCLVAYTIAEAGQRDDFNRLSSRTLAFDEGPLPVPWVNAPMICVNPLNWTVSEDRAEPDAHIGAALATGPAYGARPPAVSGAIGAACRGGILVVDRPQQSYLRQGGLLAEKWKVPPFNLFFHDLAVNAGVRLEALVALVEEEAQWLDPITQSIDVGDSPVNKVPDIRP